ncbi:TonB-dependent receptor plug domain-containing protein, partial [Acinetobacter baumannii]
RTNPLIDLNAVERIEVVAGASSLYGSGATGGTVNFITRKAEDGKPTVSVNGAVRAFTANIGQSLAPELSGTVSGIANGT